MTLSRRRSSMKRRFSPVTPFWLRGLFKVVAELSFEQVIDALDALLLAQLLTIADQFAAPRIVPVLSRWLSAALLNRARRLIALLALEEELHALTPAQATLFSSISCQSSASSQALRDMPAGVLRRAASVMRDRRHIANNADFDAGLTGWRGLPIRVPNPAP